MPAALGISRAVREDEVEVPATRGIPVDHGVALVGLLRDPVVSRCPEPEPERVEARDGSDDGKLSHCDAVWIGMVVWMAIQ